MEEWIIGFDARSMSFKDSLTSHPGIRTGLLRQDITKPLSVDSSIWSSIFNDGPYPLITGSQREEIGLGAIALPQEIGINTPLWDNLKNLEKHLTHIEVKSPYWIIAVTGLIKYLDQKRDPNDWPHTCKTTPSRINPTWQLLGYDINTCWNECCLTGTLFSENEEKLKALSESWRPYLNEFHLFTEINKAIEYKEFIDEVEKNESPHGVFGIWLVKKFEKIK